MQQPDSSTNYYQQPPLMISVGSPTIGFNPAHQQQQQQMSPQHLVRYRHSCEHCRKRKIKCSGTRPICDHCLRRGIQCIYKPLARTPRRTVSTGSGGSGGSSLHNNSHGVQPISIPTSNAAFLSPLASSSYLHTDIASAPAFHSMSPLLGGYGGIPLNNGAKTHQQQQLIPEYGSLPKSLRSPAPAIPSHMHMYYNGAIATPGNMSIHSPSDNLSGTPGSFTSIQSDFSDASPSSHHGFTQIPVTPTTPTTKISASMDAVGMLGPGLLGLQMDDPAQSYQMIPPSIDSAVPFSRVQPHQQHPSIAFAHHYQQQESMMMGGFSLPNQQLGGSGNLCSSDSLSDTIGYQRRATDDSADSIPLLERSTMGQQQSSDYYSGTDRPSNVNESGISDEILSYYFSTSTQQQQQQQQQQELHVDGTGGGIAPGLTLYQHTAGSSSVTNGHHHPMAGNDDR
ncbi:hypothetical protein EV175_000377 [Coemansia sp. RSA 1933]|nr:hypothetical protein EV175_000377 [Coemansia sp. RSA 1933]